MNKLLFITIILGASIFVSSCKKKENPGLSINPENFHGAWKHNFQLPPAFWFPPEFKKIIFSDDSFFMTYRWRKDILTLECPYEMGIWYLKGNYKVNETKLFLSGNFTDDKFNILYAGSGCDSVGKYIDSFQISYINENIINLYWLTPQKSVLESNKKIELNRIE